MHFLTSDLNTMHTEALRAEARREAQAQAARQSQTARQSFSLSAFLHRLFAVPVRPA
ncbi:hypothetical protein ACFFLM_10110 [Deinococcus oregonensis]|uniref:Uncharacterized protein n=1 Tax=Deinococcus oregonensis TaxID=1805970 RepID=A0ABV6B1J1_9DEIO